METQSSGDMVPVLLHDHCENVVIWKPCDLDDRERKELFVSRGEMSFSRVYAKSGSGREDHASTTRIPSSPPNDQVDD